MRHLGSDNWSLNDDDREEWINNFEPLFDWYRQWLREHRRDQKRMPAFIRENRTLIDETIKNQLNIKPSS
jgi:hypothetical protein